MDVDCYRLAYNIFYRNWQRFGIPEKDIPLPKTEEADPLNVIIPGFSKAVLFFQITSRRDLKTFLDECPRVHNLNDFSTRFETIVKKVFPERFVIVDLSKDSKKKGPSKVSGKEDQSEDTMETDLSTDITEEDLSEGSKLESLPEDSKKESLPKDSKKESLLKDSKKEDISEDTMETDLSVDLAEEDLSEDSKLENLPEDSKKESQSKHSKKESLPKDRKKEDISEYTMETDLSTDIAEDLSEDSKLENLPEDSRKESQFKVGKKESLPKDSKKEDISEDTMETDLSENITEEDLSEDCKKERLPEERKKERQTEAGKKESLFEDNRIEAEEVPQLIAFSLAVCTELILYQYEDNKKYMQNLPDLWIKHFNENLKDLCHEAGCTLEWLKAYSESIRCPDNFLNKFITENKDEYYNIESKFRNYLHENYAVESPEHSKFIIEVSSFPKRLCFSRMKAQFRAIVESCKCVKGKATEKVPLLDDWSTTPSSP